MDHRRSIIPDFWQVDVVLRAEGLAHREPSATAPGDSSRRRDADRADYHACGRSGSPDAEAEASTRT